MKKKLFFFLLVINLAFGDELKNYLDSLNNELFSLKLKESNLEGKKLSLDWIGGIFITYSRNFSTQYENKSFISQNFSISIEQAIFRFGGILFGIKYSKALANSKSLAIEKEKRSLIVRAYEIAINLKKSSLELKKMKLKIKNDELEYKKKRDLFNRGALDSIELNRAILALDMDRVQLLNIKREISFYKNEFKKISKKDPLKISIPPLKIFSKKEYVNNNYDLLIKEAQVRKDYYQKNATITKYLPTISLYASFNHITPTLVGKSSYINYGLKVTMPIYINEFIDIERAKVSYLKSRVEKLVLKNSLKKEYKDIVEGIKLIDQKIDISKKDKKLYYKLYLDTKEQFKSGSKTKVDVEIMKNSYYIKKLDIKILEYEKSLEILKLYKKVRG
ncbi:MAG: TolC family protein [Epsilonproteobacteria bacterium]|nr:TolC family protein [Campylobacterota bacterium]